MNHLQRTSTQLINVIVFTKIRRRYKQKIFHACAMATICLLNPPKLEANSIKCPSIIRVWFDLIRDILRPSLNDKLSHRSDDKAKPCHDLGSICVLRNNNDRRTDGSLFATALCLQTNRRSSRSALSLSCSIGYDTIQFFNFTYFVFIYSCNSFIDEPWYYYSMYSWWSLFLWRHGFSLFWNRKLLWVITCDNYDHQRLIFVPAFWRFVKIWYLFIVRGFFL